MVLSGLIPILATPFTEDGELDLPGLRRLTEWQLDSGADGVAVFGMASEGFALTAGDRARVLAEVRAAAGAAPVVAGVGATSTATALEQALAARDGGADALMVLPPYLVKPSGAQLVDFYGAVAERAGIDVMVQDAPGATGVSMPESLIVELSKLDGVTSVKVEAPPTAPKVGAVAAGVPDGFAVFGGQNALFCLEEYALGAIGTMPACEFTDLLAPVLADWAAGRTAQARAGHARLLPLIRFGMQPGLAWAVHKEVLVRRGLITSATVRSPARPLDRHTRILLDALMAELW
ncbi:4-hydroxy-tetrahydrodipicolinate synthase [[Actinomadura] parvosata subsp. kistnae]|uniref:Dihydrodipicolinate synthase family protein n=1 Tax=[Actinomadura] parvosata subsp. kistnae TaxID=1909395 RepID=A0A1V0A0B1_9ACTN|nr:dihydrodipicolinate synthase family protein [Nonomuraea sp. ATCC 55076]AQZ63612.1 dihydrodipicolinate synthase family protein [Nonomuraea sp. ATCC 55076]SPL99388.1 4-hydroxy-tetrahydrodipicolinate synthase [Actinomadura parvosata subsp. kistnae]